MKLKRCARATRHAFANQSPKHMPQSPAARTRRKLRHAFAKIAARSQAPAGVTRGDVIGPRSCRAPRRSRGL